MTCNNVHQKAHMALNKDIDPIKLAIVVAAPATAAPPSGPARRPLLVGRGAAARAQQRRADTGFPACAFIGQQCCKEDACTCGHVHQLNRGEPS